MTMRQRILAVAGAAALLVATLPTGYGNGPVDTSSVTIQPGPLTASLTWASFEEPSSNVGTSREGQVVLRVLDERGYATGWQVSVSTEDYAVPEGHLGADKLALLPVGVSTVRGNPNLANHSTFTVNSMRTNPTLLWSVPNLSGDGEYDLALVGTLGVPAGTRENYLYTVIVNIIGGAP